MFAMFRRYNRWHSRFDQPDPYDGSYAFTNPQSLNRYAYVDGDPVNFVDPSGLMMNCHSNIEWVPHIEGGGDWIERADVCSRVPDDWYNPRDPIVPDPEPPPAPKPIWCDPDVIKAMNKAWSQSKNAGQAGRGVSPIEAGFNLNGTPSKFKVSSSYTNQVGKMTIKYNNLSNSDPTFANFHVHPKGFDGHNGFPSTPASNYENNGKGDSGSFDEIYKMKQPQGNQSIQVFVMSWYGLSMYDPATGVSQQLVKGVGFLKGEGCPP